MCLSDKTWTRILIAFYSALFWLMIMALLGGCSYTIKQGDPVKVEQKS